MRGTSATGRSAFTLIELLVVVAIIALLISILLPSLSAAREQARAAKCGSHLRGFGAGFNIYAQENKDWIPGVNTTGFVLKEEALTLRFLRQPHLPAQTFDWLSPLLRLETTDLGTNRAERFALIQEKYRCPSQSTVNSIIYRPPPDAEDFQKIGSWSAISYLMPAYFQYFGTYYDPDGPNKYVIGYVKNGNRPVHGEAIKLHWKWEVDSGKFVSKLTRIGHPAQKIAVADGTRYLARDGGLDHDVAPIPDLFGAFSDSGGWWWGSRAYGVEMGTVTWDGQQTTNDQPGRGRNLPLSYRHGGVDRSRVTRGCQDNSGMINALFFDGHVARLTDRASRRIEYWYPSGSIVTKSEGMTYAPPGFVIP